MNRSSHGLAASTICAAAIGCVPTRNSSGSGTPTRKGSVIAVAIKEVWIPSPHYSSPQSYMVAAFHTTEGAMKYRDLGAWFQNPSAQCSSHHGADNYERGVFGAYVYEDKKAWTQAGANPWTLSIELCAYASWSRSTWLNSKSILVDNAAEWLNYICDKYHIPFTLLNNSQAQSGTVKGVCQHVNFGSMGSGHHDCGDGFPIDVVLDKAKKWGSGGSQPAPEGSSLMSASVAIYQGKQYFAYLNGAGTVCVNGGAVDPSQKGASSGCDIAIDQETGRKVVSYSNGDRIFCTYTQEPGSNSWAWTSKKWTTK